VLEIARQWAAKGVRALVVITAGFAEVGGEGIDLQRQLFEICRHAGMRLVGPNCMGVINTAEDVKLDATFAPDTPTLGRIGFLSQSGGLGIAVMARAQALGLPIYELLGGRVSQSDGLLLYSNGWFTGCSTPDEFAKAAAKTVADGHTALKLDPFRGGHAYLSRYAAGYPPEADMEAVAIVERIREAVGPGVEIFIDAHGRFELPTAVRLANRLAIDLQIRNRGRFQAIQ